MMPSGTRNSCEELVSVLRRPRFIGWPGLNYNYFRDYDPGTGKYVGSDPIGLDGGDNTYAYVANEPLGLVDPLGLVKECITKLMLVTAYDDRGPGRNWAYYKSHPGGGSKHCGCC